MKKAISLILILILFCSAINGCAEGNATETWTCPNCGREGNNGNFCPNCATERPAGLIICPNCGAEFDRSLDFKFCPNCATQLNRNFPDPSPASQPRETGMKVGDTIIFGRFEQDGNPDNGAEPIEWIIIDIQGNKALLLTKYALDEKPYNTDYTEVTWEDSWVRNWLNTGFYMDAFNKTEQSAIQTTLIDNSPSQGHPEFSTSGGNDTEDEIFLLSYHEAFEQYFSRDKERMCTATRYAFKKDLVATSDNYKVNGSNAMEWWLRSPGAGQKQALYVAGRGICSLHGLYVNKYAGIRPALWVELSADVIGQ